MNGVTREQVERVLELEAKATAGGWHHARDCLSCYVTTLAGGFGSVIVKAKLEDDAAFTAECRNLIGPLARDWLQLRDLVRSADTDDLSIGSVKYGEFHSDTEEYLPPVILPNIPTLEDELAAARARIAELEAEPHDWTVLYEQRINELTTERDAARAEVERLKAELEAAE